MREDEEFRQLVAQRMLSSQPVATPNSRHNQHHEHGLRRRDTFDYGFDEISESQLIPPWEVDYNHTSNDGGGRRGMQSYPEQSDVRDVIKLDTPHHLMSTNNTYEINTNNIATDAPNTPTTPKFVSFGTHDKIHHFDDQLDQLKFVDEEFLSLAHFLLEVVGVGSVLNGDEDWFDDALLEDGNVGVDKVFKGSMHARDGVDKRRNGILSRLCVCGDGDDVLDDDELAYHGINGEVIGGDGIRSTHSFGNTDNTSGLPRTRRRYRLTEKLIRDFELAVRFRMENIALMNVSGEDGGVESGIVAPTREIARKIEAYGLPKLPKRAIDCTAVVENACDEEDRDHGVISVGSKDEHVVSMHQRSSSFLPRQSGLPLFFPLSFQTSPEDERRRRDAHFFPVLPGVDDDDENDQCHSNTNRHISNKIMSSSSPPFFATFLKSTSSTPSDENCQWRLHQIRREIEKVQHMSKSTQNKAVQSACQKRISKLNDERRFYQIIKERHKLQSMLEKTEMDNVKFACKERINQLLIELESLNVTEDEDFDMTKANATAYERLSQRQGNDWHQRVLKYVNPNDEQEMWHPLRERGQQDRQYRFQQTTPRRYEQYDSSYTPMQQSTDRYSMQYSDTRRNLYPICFDASSPRRRTYGRLPLAQPVKRNG